MIFSMFTMLSFGHTGAQQLDKSEMKVTYRETMLGNPGVQLNAQAPIWGTHSSNYCSGGDHLGTLPGGFKAEQQRIVQGWVKAIVTSYTK